MKLLLSKYNIIILKVIPTLFAAGSGDDFSTLVHGEPWLGSLLAASLVSTYVEVYSTVCSARQRYYYMAL
jgi:hypothetical protein